jgi:hypothetical protein
MPNNSIVLGACILFAIGAVIVIILGAMSHNVASIVVGSIILIAAAVFFISAWMERKQIGGRQRVT